MMGTESEQTKLIKPRELDIYYEPPQVYPIECPDSVPNLFYNNVSVARQKLTDVFPKLLTVHEKVNKVYNWFTSLRSVETKLIATYDNVMSDPYSLLVPGSIAFATAAGSIFAGRGRKPFKRTFYTIVFAGTATTVCYPQRSFDVAKTGYYHSTSTLQILYQKLQSLTTTEKAVKTMKAVKNEQIISPHEDNEANIEETTFDGSASDKYDPSQTEMKIVETDVVKVDGAIGNKEFVANDEFVSLDVKEESESKLNVEADYGQSNPEDSDMYSTRS